MTVAYGVPIINTKGDFDRTLDDFPPRKYFLFLRQYIAFAWALNRFEIFNYSFDFGFLMNTPLASLECQLLKLAGKKIVVAPYGGDICVPEYLGFFREVIVATYPQYIVLGPGIKKRVLYVSKWADFIIKNTQVGFLPRYEILWPTFGGIDEQQWTSGVPASSADGTNGVVVVVHPSNHRAIKGTDALIQAVQELQTEGLKVRLDLFEKRPNEEVKEAVRKCDIIAEQFIGGYALTAIEGMTAGKPVLANLSWDGIELFKKNTCIKDCPIMDTTLDQIKDNLRKLVKNPQLRSELGAASRRYALKHHSEKAIGGVWDAIFRHVWDGEPKDIILASLKGLPDQPSYQ